MLYIRGFTLIELLVVIAIIGILAGIVLAALGTTRQKGADIGVAGNMSGLRTKAELYIGSNANSYSNFCTSSSAQNALKAAAAAGGSNVVDFTLTNGVNSTRVECHDSTNAWGAAASLKTTPTTFWCADSNGYSATTTTGIAANSYVCQ